MTMNTKQDRMPRLDKWHAAAVTGEGEVSREDYHKQYENEQRANRACGIYHGEYWAKRAIASVLEETGIQLHFEHIADWQCRIYRKFGNI